MTHCVETRNQFLSSARSHLTSDMIGELSGARIFITGGTGFLGSWIVDLLFFLSKYEHVDLSITILTRRLPALRAARPDWFSTPIIQFIEGDIKTVSFTSARYTHLIHAAADTSLEAATRKLELIDSILLGSRRVLDFAINARVRHILFLSSGAAVAPNRFATSFVGEDSTTAPQIGDLASGYGHAKRIAEHMHLVACHDHGIRVVVARGFSFAGPRLPLNSHLAIAAFIRDAISGKGPQINGDGSAVRAYLFSVDAAAWLLTMLVGGRSGRTYNVGSDMAMRLYDLAQEVSRVLAAPPPIIKNPRSAKDEIDFYVPDISRARNELGLAPWTTIEESIRWTADWMLKNIEH